MEQTFGGNIVIITGGEEAERADDKEKESNYVQELVGLSSYWSYSDCSSSL